MKKCFVTLRIERREVRGSSQYNPQLVGAFLEAYTKHRDLNEADVAAMSGAIWRLTCDRSRKRVKSIFDRADAGTLDQKFITKRRGALRVLHPQRREDLLNMIDSVWRAGA